MKFAGRHPVPCKVVLDDVSAADLSGEAEEAFANALMDTHSGVADLSHVQGTSFDDYTASRRLLNVRYTAGRLEGGSCAAVTFDLHTPLNGQLRRGPSAIIPSSFLFIRRITV